MSSDIFLSKLASRLAICIAAALSLVSCELLPNSGSGETNPPAKRKQSTSKNLNADCACMLGDELHAFAHKPPLNYQSWDGKEVNVKVIGICRLVTCPNGAGEVMNVNQTFKVDVDLQRHTTGVVYQYYLRGSLVK